MNENEISAIVVDCSLKIHRELGPGLLESVYLTVLAYELKKRNLKVQQQVAIPIVYDGIYIDMSFRADIIIERIVLVETKSVERLNPVHYKQVLTYLKILDLKLGLLINFNEELIKHGIHRVVNKLR